MKRMESVGQREEQKCKNRQGDPGAPCRGSRGAGGTTTLAFTILFKRKSEVTELSVGDRKQPGRPDPGCVPWVR